MAISLVFETSELLEHFQWKNEKQLAGYLKTAKGQIADEIADVLYWVLLIAHDLKIDVVQSLRQKMIQNEAKYPVHKAKGRSTKYKDL
jgi:dCTP diphosphatase